MATALFGESSTSSYRSSARSFTTTVVPKRLETQLSTTRAQEQDKELASLKQFVEERTCEGRVSICER